MPPVDQKRNGIMLRVFAGASVVALFGILGLSFSNLAAMAQHNSADGTHGDIVKDLAKIKADVDWIRKTIEMRSE